MTSHKQAWTKGPWMAAAKPSSVVGWPVVAQSGRSIASVTYFKLGDQFSNHDAESGANARLIAAAPEMYEALKEMCATFKPFRMRPVGGEGSAARLDQENQIAVYETAMAALAKTEG